MTVLTMTLNSLFGRSVGRKTYYLILLSLRPRKPGTLYTPIVSAMFAVAGCFSKYFLSLEHINTFFVFGPSCNISKYALDFIRFLSRCKIIFFLRNEYFSVSTDVFWRSLGLRPRNPPILYALSIFDLRLIVIFCLLT